MRKSKTLHRIARSLDIPDRRIRVIHTVPRPEGWTESTADMGRWATMIRTRK